MEISDCLCQASREEYWKVELDSVKMAQPDTVWNSIVFYALKGQNNDGHDDVRSLCDRGVRHFVLMERMSESFGTDAETYR